MQTQGGTTLPVQSDAGKSAAVGTSDPGSRQERARKLVKRNVYWVAGLGLIPIPVLDLVMITGVQVKMLKELSEVYEVKFFADKAQTIVGALIAGIGGLSIAGTIASSLFKVVPGLGWLVGTLGPSLFGGALTLSVGNLFILHYEAGGTLLNFDAEKMRAHFQKEFAQARNSVREIHSERQAADDDDPIAP